ncbi:MAG: hypothetical protein NTU44_10865, partial [Bacteroidetes bacterium]|nr:hypothetical protein [Bacteroidota bacterium]
SGEITFNPQGGVPPYEYSILDWNNIFHIFTSWTPFQTNNIFNSLPGLYAVNYPVRIVDQFGCLFTTYVQVGSPPDIVLTDTNITHVSCYRYKDGEISVQGQGGTGPLLYALNNGIYDTVTFFPGLDTGMYFIQVRDSVLCERVFGPFEIIEPTPIVMTAVTSSTNNCADTMHFKVVINVTGGSDTYVNYWFFNNAGIQLYTGPSNTIQGLSPGDYSTVVLDSRGCADTINFSIFPLPVVFLGSDTTLIYQGQTILLNAGNPGCSFLWSDGSTDQTLSVDIAGIYWVSVTNDQGCSQTDTIVVNNQILSSLQGILVYNNSFSTPLDSLTVYLKTVDNTLLDSTLTNVNGEFSFTTMPGEYHIGIKCSKPIGGLNSLDALIICKHFVGMDCRHGYPDRNPVNCCRCGWKWQSECK